MDFPANQVLLYKHQMDMGPHMQVAYANLVNADMTHDHPLIKAQVLTDDLENYLNQYFPGCWRLLRRVEEKRHHIGASPYKIAYYVLQFDTDADAETVSSRLAKDGYKTPAEKILTNHPPLPKPGTTVTITVGHRAHPGGNGNGGKP